MTPAARPAQAFGVGVALAVVAVFVMCLTLSTRAQADEITPLALDYSAPPECPGPDRFLGDVAARTPVFRRARPSEPSLALRVVVERVPGGNKGTLELESTDGTRSTRKVSAADCEQVVSALALMTALAIDPDASTAPVPSPTPPPVPSPPPPPPVATAPAPPRATSTRWRVQAGVVLEGLGGVTPETLLFVRPYLEIGRFGASPWGAAFRLSGASAHTTVTGAEGGAEYQLVAGRLEGCPATFRGASGLRLSSCLALDAGRLEVVGVGVTPSERVAPPFVAAGLLARLDWQVLDVLVVEVAADLLVPFTRDRFFVHSDTTVHRTPFVVGGAALGLGVRFP